MKKGRKKTKRVLSILAILVILFGIYAVVSGGREGGSGGELNTEIPESSRELEFGKEYNGYAILDGSVNMHEGEATIQVVNEKNDVLWEQTFNEGTTKIEPIKIKNFDGLTLNTKCMSGEGEYAINFHQNKFLKFIDSILGK